MLNDTTKLYSFPKDGLTPICHASFWMSGRYGKGETPDPISNSVVKPLSADDTSS